MKFFSCDLDQIFFKNYIDVGHGSDGLLRILEKDEKYNLLLH